MKSLEDYRQTVAHDDAHLLAYTEAIGGVAKRRAPVRIALRGLVASPGGVLVKGWPATDLQSLRRELHAAMARSGVPLWGPESQASGLRNTCHATLALFGDTVARPDELDIFIDAHRDTHFGEWTADEVWLAGYRRIARSVRLMTYARLRFAGED